MKRITTILITLIYSISAFAGSAFVICEHSDGDKAFETFHQEQSHCSSHKHDSKEEEHHSKKIEKEHCGPCDDTRISTDESTILAIKKFKISERFLNSESGKHDNNFILRTLDSQWIYKSPPEESSVLKTIRNTVLLI